MSKMSSSNALQSSRCPRCGKTFKYKSIQVHKPYPFCSQRCRDVDLGNWINGNYVISQPTLATEEDVFQEPVE